jgi:hypothetical protein
MEDLPIGVPFPPHPRRTAMTEDVRMILGVGGVSLLAFAAGFLWGMVFHRSFCRRRTFHD